MAYYITALVHPFVGVDPEGWHQVGITAAIAVIASGFTAYFWLSRLTNRSAGLIAAIFYMSEPYHVAFTLYGRFGFAELWAFVWLPLLMMWVQDITAGRKDGLLKLAFGYALLIMTHLPTALVFSPVLAAYGLTLSPAGLRLNRSARLAAAMSLP